jgi:PAS domain S-box-containing protein
VSSSEIGEAANRNNLLLLGLIVAGLAGNYFKYPIFLNIDFLFGSIFAMLALQYFGLGRGVIAAALISGVTYFLWNHPYAILIMTAEVAVVGELVRQGRARLVLADALYWVFMGMPLVFVFYHLVMDAPLDSVYLTMMKQATNGIANALVARLIFIGFSLRFRATQTSLGEIIYNLLVFFVLLPALVMLGLSSRSDFHETDQSIRASLTHDKKLVGKILETWVNDKSLDIQNQAELAASMSPQQMQPYLETTRKSDSSYLRVGMINKAGISVAVSPLVDEMGKSTLGIDFSDRPYIPVLRQTLKPMLSEVVMSRMGKSKPIVLMLAPVVKNGRYDGYVYGVLDLDSIRAVFAKSFKDSRYTLTDKNGNVIMTNRKDQVVMKPFARGSGTLTPLEPGIGQWIPPLPPNTPISERWKNSFYVGESPVGETSEWTLFLEQPVTPFQKKLYESYAGKLTILFFILLSAIMLAEFFGRRTAAKLELLNKLTLGLPARLAEKNSVIAWPQTGIREINSLIHNFKETGDSLAEQFNEVRRVNDSLEQRVKERTAKLRESEERLRLELERLPIAHIVWGADFKVAAWNPAAEKIFGYTAAEALGRHPYDLIVPKTLQPQLDDLWTRLLKGDESSLSSTNENITKDGRTILCEWTNTPLKKPHGPVFAVMATAQDISERKRAELALQRSNHALRTLGSCNEALVRATDESELLQSICRIIVETGGYRMAWVGFPEQDQEKTVRLITQYGDHDGYLRNAKISWADNALGRGPTGTAIRTGTAHVNQSFLDNPESTPWREHALKHGYHSSIALPLSHAAGVVGALTIYAAEPNAFNEDEVKLLQELANDLTYGIITLRTRQERDRIAYEHKHHAEILRESLEDSIKAIAATVEMRDPYTAGHQRRVGELAAAIGRELGLPEERIHGIALAAGIHDLGKINVPAEILSKPTKLKDFELVMVKYHAQAGYDILKNIKFPWPIATMVWQHHERMDGSGYPQGLKGDEILLESRILAVADVVEAMASHRPYRASLGTDAALKEIERGRGGPYDAVVVDACLKLFREGRFALPG